MIGTTVGHYRVLALLGRGAMGEVYLAHDERLGRRVALKLLPAAFANDPERRHHFEREARVLAALNHPGIVGVHGIEREGDLLLLAMEYVDGTPLGALIPSAGMALDEIVRIGVALAEAVGAAHQQGVVHRDLKPANVMVSAEGGVKVLDFGLAKIRRPFESGAGAPVEGSSSATIPGTIIGTAHYMSPEQAQGLPVDARSDIFSLGVVLFHMATGRRPFEGETTLAVLSSIIKDTPPPVTTIRPDLPPAFAGLVARCLEKEPGRRVQDALDLAAQLHDAAADRTASAVSTTPSDTAPRHRAGPAPGLRLRWVLVPVILAGIAAAAALGANRARRPSLVPAAARVAVAPFENRTGDRANDAVGLMVADRIAQGLVAQLGLEVVAGPAVLDAWPASQPAASGKPATDRIRLLARRVGAAVVVSGDYYTAGEEMSFRARITDARTARDVAQFGPVTGPRDSPATTAEAVRQYVVGESAIYFKGGGGAATAGIPSSFAAGAPPMSYEAYQEFLAGLEAFGRDPRAAIAHLERVEQLFPSRALVLPWLVLSYMRVGDLDTADRYVTAVRGRLAPEDMPLADYFRARLDGRWLDAYRAITTLHRSMPLHLPTVNTAAGAAIALGRPREAVALLSSVDATPWRDSTSGRAWLSARADVHHMLGEYEDESKVATTLLETAPEAASVLVRSLAALGRADEITAVTERALLGARPGALPPAAPLVQLAAEELRAHGHAQASRAMAERGLEWISALDRDAARSAAALQLQGDLLALLGRWRSAARVFTRLAEERPEDIAALSGLGVALAHQGDAAAAERTSAHLARPDKRHLLGRHIYARARIAAALGRRDRAVVLLQQAFAEGVIIIWRAHADQAFDAVRGYAPFDHLTMMDQAKARLPDVP